MIFPTHHHTSWVIYDMNILFIAPNKIKRLADFL
jgi:hypothetical protein